jgi:hypothetical protein
MFYGVKVSGILLGMMNYLLTKKKCPSQSGARIFAITGV